MGAIVAPFRVLNRKNVIGETVFFFKNWYISRHVQRTGSWSAFRYFFSKSRPFYNGVPPDHRGDWL